MRRVRLSRNMLNLPGALLLAFLTMQVALSLPARVEAADVLSLDDCLRIADANHPSLAGAAAQIAMERGRLGQTVVADFDVDGAIVTDSALQQNGTCA